MQNLLITLFIVLCLTFQTAAQNVATHEATATTVISALLYSPYIAALLSLVLLIATLI